MGLKKVFIILQVVTLSAWADEIGGYEKQESLPPLDEPSIDEPAATASSPDSESDDVLKMGTSFNTHIYKAIKELQTKSNKLETEIMGHKQAVGKSFSEDRAATVGLKEEFRQMKTQMAEQRQKHDQYVAAQNSKVATLESRVTELENDNRSLRGHLCYGVWGLQFCDRK
jgi:hypothetical protein